MTNLLRLAGGSSSLTLNEFISYVTANTYNTTNITSSGDPLSQALALASAALPSPPSITTPPPIPPTQGVDIPSRANVTQILNAMDRLECLLALMPRPQSPFFPTPFVVLGASLSGNVSLNNVANFFDGPSIAQGSAGTWFASGTVTVHDTAGAATFDAKLWDGTTVIASTEVTSPAANQNVAISLSGVQGAPQGNLRISVKDTSATTGLIMAAAGSGNTASTITVFRLR